MTKLSTPKKKKKNADQMQFKAFVHDEMQLYCEVIEDCISVTRNRVHNIVSLFRLQCQICQDLGNVQATISLSKKEIKKILSKVDEDRDKLSAEKLKELEAYESHHFMFKVVENAFKTVMDGLVWRIFLFNRAFIYSLSEPDEGPGHMQIGQTSFEKELDAFVSTFNDQKGIAILNDITNIIRFGDITKFVSKSDGEGEWEWEIEEVKIGKPRSKAKIRAEKQKEKLREFITLVSSGTREREDETRIIEVYRTPVKHYLDELEDMLKQLEAVPLVTRKLAAHIIVEVFDPYKLHLLPEGSIHDDLKTLLSPWRDERVISLDSLRRARTFMRGSAPYSIFPFDDSICAKLITGQIAYRAWINIDELKKYFEGAGWQIIQDLHETLEEEFIDGDLPYTKEEVRKMPIFTIQKEAFHTTIPPLFITRIAYELLAPETILNMAEDMMKRGPREQGDDCEILMDLPDERRIWR